MGYGTMKNGHMKKPGGFPSGNYDGNAFGVMHYAAMVTYACDNWWEQNKSTLPCWIHEVITTSTWEGRAAAEDREAGRYMMALFEETRNGNGKAATIGSQFREQLLLLVDHTLEASNCTCQFVRCIKPNKDKFSRATAVPTADNAWQSAMVLNQLRYTGMLDTLMIRKKGFPTRPDHATFWKKFQIQTSRNCLTTSGNESHLQTSQTFSRNHTTTGEKPLVTAQRITKLVMALRAC